MVSHLFQKVTGIRFQLGCFVNLSICLSYLTIYLSISHDLSVHLSVNIYLSIPLSTCIYLSRPLSIYLATCSYLYFHLSIYYIIIMYIIYNYIFTIKPSIYLSIYIHVNRFVFTQTCENATFIYIIITY